MKISSVGGYEMGSIKKYISGAENGGCPCAAEVCIKKVNPLSPLGVFGTFPIKVATKAPVEEPMLQPSKLAPQSSISDGQNMEQNYIFRNTKHNIVYLFEFYSDILP